MIATRRACFVALAMVVALPLAGCKIVPIAEQEAPAGFDGAAYVAGLWDERALPYFAEAARPASEVIPAIGADLAAAGAQFGYRAGEGSPWSFVVSGSGTVRAKHTQSRAGTLEVAVDGLAEPVVLQIGPVIRGNAVRDALPFVAFKDFVNQLEYANAGKALTAAALAGFSSAADAVAVGDTVRFTGAIGVSAGSDAVLVTPVTLEVLP